MSTSIVTPAAATPPASTSTPASIASTNYQTMFLQLLVAQLQNQDPMNPTDGTQFVTQLAQMQGVEESINTGQDVTAIRQDLDQIIASYTAGSSSTGTGSTSQT